MSGVRYIEGASLVAGETLRYDTQGIGKILPMSYFYGIFKSIVETADKRKEVKKKSQDIVKLLIREISSCCHVLEK